MTIHDELKQLTKDGVITGYGVTGDTKTDPTYSGGVDLADGTRISFAYDGSTLTVGDQTADSLTDALTGA